MTIVIYGLCDPDTDEVRYVGKSNNPITRLKQHLSVHNPDTRSRKAHWIRSLVSVGKQPAMIILDEVTPETWREREEYWISYYRTQNDLITNGNRGGGGFHQKRKPSVLGKQIMVRLNAEQQAALKQAEEDYDLTKSHLIRKAIDMVYVLKLISIADGFKAQEEQAAA